MLGYRDKLVPRIKEALDRVSQASYFTREELMREVMSDPKLQNIMAELRKLKGWDIEKLLEAQVGVLTGKLISDAKGRYGLPLYRSYPVPGGPKRHVKFLEMTRAQMQAALGVRVARAQSMISGMTLDRKILDLLTAGPPELTVADVVDKALRDVQPKALRGA